MSNLLKRPERLRDRIFTKLFDVAELAQLDDEDRIKYIKSMNTERDTYNQIEYARESGREEGRKEGHKKGHAEGREEGLKEGHKEGHKEGKEEGLKEGREEGRGEERLKIAMNLIRVGASCEIITQATGLSAEEVSRLKEEMRNA